ncbi:hypothetical protein RND61_00245 [Streptomyces sp. TRM76323]|uniref:Amino acid ABC transporter permease n=1 Tax=Streptomyces tamarix TaxID=3078565 RepID=A0ABU3QCN0_9ACTN|nr:hypothetical protein [Streptomyces tamarix]MDT9680523.1 hypothetical protein [Streptomyces tamarix]
MEYSQRWQQMFGLPPDDGADARLELASAAADGGGGGTSGQGRLKHTDGPWGRASGTAAELSTSTEKSRSALGPGHDGISTGAAGLASVASLKSVLKSWEDRLAAVRDECDHLEGALRKVAVEMGETDVAVKDTIAPVKAGGAAK